MKALKLKSAAFTMTFLVAFLLVDFAYSAPAQIKRLNLYDAQENYLMYVEYEYDKNGKDTAYSVYFSDGTFTRRVVIGRNASGFKEKETALNFTGDTVFKSTFNSNGTKTDVAIKDQFNVDQLGGPASYTKNALEYTFTNGSYTHKIAYEYNTAGQMTKINIFGGDGKLAYFGLLDSSNVGVFSPGSRQKAAYSSVSLRGSEAISWKFTLDRASKVKCEAMSLTGRRVAVLYSGSLPQGSHSKIFRLGSSPYLTNGVFVAVMSIDGKPVANTKFIVQSIRGGAR